MVVNRLIRLLFSFKRQGVNTEWLAKHHQDGDTLKQFVDLMQTHVPAVHVCTGQWTLQPLAELASVQHILAQTLFQAGEQKAGSDVHMQSMQGSSSSTMLAESPAGGTGGSGQRATSLSEAMQHEHNHSFVLHLQRFGGLSQPNDGSWPE